MAWLLGCWLGFELACLLVLRLASSLGSQSVCLLELKLEFEWEFRLVWLLGCWSGFELA